MFSSVLSQNAKVNCALHMNLKRVHSFLCDEIVITVSLQEQLQEFRKWSNRQYLHILSVITFYVKVKFHSYLSDGKPPEETEHAHDGIIDESVHGRVVVHYKLNNQKADAANHKSTVKPKHWSEVTLPDLGTITFIPLFCAFGALWRFVPYTSAVCSLTYSNKANNVLKA